jgi:PBSX family phage portal protein
MAKMRVKPLPAAKSVKRLGGRARVRNITTKRNDGAAPFMSLVTKAGVPLRSTDVFNGMLSTDGDIEMAIIEPEYEYKLILEAAKRNSALNQCIEAYKINMESYGYQLEYAGPAGKENKPAMQAQKNAAIVFLDNAGTDKSLRIMRENSRLDKEYLGDRYFEVGRDVLDRPSWIEHIPTMNLRRTKKDKKATEYEVRVRMPDGTIATQQKTKKFCRYVQVSNTGVKVYFKELDDPRSIDPKTGKVNEGLAIEDQATEIWADTLYSPGSNYGVPRWIGALPDMLGLRESELVNLNFFRENAIPAMALLISGGALTEESFDKVNNIINAAKGKDAMNRIVILEAASDDSVGSTDNAPPAPKIELKMLGGDRQSDGNWGEYQTSAKRKIRSAMRLPALYTGDTEEYTKATSQSGIRVAESQVFAPERSLFDEFVNNRLFPRLGITNWTFKSVGPPVYDPDTLSTMIDRFGRHGAMTPNILIKIANKVLDVQIPSVTDKWGDVPFTYTMGMVNSGMQLENFEDVFATINDAAAVAAQNAADAAAEAGNDNDAGAKPANDNSANAGAVAAKRMIRRELIAMTDEIIERINAGTTAA